MNFKNSLLAIFFFTFLFVLLFYKQWLGLNLVLFEVAYFGYLFYSKKMVFTKNLTITFILLVATLVATIINYSSISYWIHFLILIVFAGMIKHVDLKSHLISFGVGSENLFANQVIFIEKLSNIKIKDRKIGALVYKYGLYILPLIVIFIFISIYAASNPIFNDYAQNILTSFWNGITFIFKNINLTLIGVFFLGLFLVNFLILENKNINLINCDRKASDNLFRKKLKQKRIFKLTALKTEYKLGTFLLIALNVLLLLLNISDIIWVWFNFEWEGQSLKQFVHEGTYLLIFSILLSILLVLFFFRKNINFLSKKYFLKILAYIWIFQNAFLALSVLRRNLWYIDYFSLAYKRIGVFIFILIIFYGLYSVFKKIKNRKSGYYLFRVNSLFVMIVLGITSMVNWDIVIAKYNFNNYKTGFVHLEWLSTLSNKTLPYLVKNKEVLNKMEDYQIKTYSDPELYQDYSQYQSKIQYRIQNFKEKWNKKSWLSWNLAEHRAYKKLRD